MNTQKSVAREVLISSHSPTHWQKRQQERSNWLGVKKEKRKSKKEVPFGEYPVDEELYPVLVLLNQLGITTEYSCAGVSILDDPEDHSLYAYVTFWDSSIAQHFIQYVITRMKHRAMITFEPERQRYDLSSFYIMHNRSFCLLLFHVVKSYQQEFHTNQ